MLLCVFFCIQIYSQTYSTGLLFDDIAYDAVPLSAPLSKSDYALPASATLRQWCPAIKNQGSYGTCVGWSSGYYARTIIEAQQKNLSGASITNDAFSPSWIYNQIRFLDHNNCQKGSYLHEALNLMQSNGIAKLNDYPYCCDCPITNDIRKKAASFKIQGYKKLFDKTDNQDTKINTIKKAISENKPVVIGFAVQNSFFNARDVWAPIAGESIVGAHAMCVIGYDDTKYGGAIELINSWGTSWGNSGFTYVRYSDFAEYCNYAFELIDNFEPTDVKLSGELTFKLRDGSTMLASKIVNLGVTSYKMNKSYASLTKFRFYMSNNNASYVYAIATDLGGEIHKIFPHKKGISPYLGYSSNTVTFPSETAYTQLDNTAGTDFMCILYSKKELDIDAIIQKMETKRGDDFNSRIAYALENKLLPFEKINYSNYKIGFEAQINDYQYIVPLIVEMKHE